MNASDSFVAGGLYWFESKGALARLLSTAGFEASVGHRALRVEGLARTFELGYVGNIAPDEPFEGRGDGSGLLPESVAAGCARDQAPSRQSGEMGELCAAMPALTIR